MKDFTCQGWTEKQLRKQVEQKCQHDNLWTQNGQGNDGRPDVDKE